MAQNTILKIKRGYLNKDFQIFHLKDKKDIKFEFHYHNFNKIVIFLSGDVTYLIEGKSYKLKPWDILLVNNNDIHKAIINPDKIYERIILWINSDFLIKHNDEFNLLSCFEFASKQRFNLLRPDKENIEHISKIIFNIESTFKDKKLGYKILRVSLFLELMVYINRLFLGQKDIKESCDIKYDRRINDILNYINKNLDKDISINFLSSKFFVSKYYLMHKFKEQTGYTIHNYILQKRLIMSTLFIKNGKSITDACIESGFRDYSNFLRAFKKRFGFSPKKYYKN
ncbi:AraC-like DNA-binding protein [Clostridium algifaecis]|uniref:AraC-like DNA-binding protein n=1 Tax=Clostridium algifaecis TaxID=1472040 RepID=A0ABS4KVZ5_9CLOT|nr:AraC family transcriptional regulator [Clostridium algifaecis]MBP2034192.1 AraC-like DNA-binding protein [Clostridium algifaecis]